MRCPACGQWNKKSLPNCFKCGQALPVSEEGEQVYIYAGMPERKTHRQQQAGVVSLTRDELLDRRARGAQFIRALRQENEKNRPQNKSHTQNYRPQNEGHAQNYRPPVESRRPRDESRPQNEKYQSAKVYSDIPPPPTRTNRRQEAELERIREKARAIKKLEQQGGTLGIRHGRNPLKFAAKVIKWVLVAAVLVCIVIGGSYGIRALMSRSAEEEGRAPAVSPVLVDGKPAHRLTFFGEEGETLFIRELAKTYIFTGEEIIIDLPDDYFIPEKPEENQAVIPVALNSVKSSPQKQQTMPEVTFEVPVPITPLELIKPGEARVETTMALYGIEIAVLENTQVLIDGKDASDLINTKGRLLHNAKVEPSGDTVVQIWAQTAYCRPYSVDIVLHRPYQEIPLELSVGTPVSANSKEVKISGTVARGASISVDFPHKSLTVDPDTGEFSFIALPTRTGDNAIIITASMTGKKDSVITHHIDYLPTLDVYSRNAWKLEYKTLTANIASWTGRIFMFYGTVESVISTTPPLYEVKLSDSENMLVIEYSGTATELAVGKKYRFYADVASEYKGLPMLIARYIFKE